MPLGGRLSTPCLQARPTALSHLIVRVGGCVKRYVALRSKNGHGRCRALVPSQRAVTPPGAVRRSAGSDRSSGPAHFGVDCYSLRSSVATLVSDSAPARRSCSAQDDNIKTGRVATLTYRVPLESSSRCSASRRSADALRPFAGERGGFLCTVSDGRTADIEIPQPGASG